MASLVEKQSMTFSTALGLRLGSIPKRLATKPATNGAAVDDPEVTLELELIL